MMATPKIEMKPTAAEMLKLVPVSSSAQTPPMRQRDHVDAAPRRRPAGAEGQVQQHEDQHQRRGNDDQQPALRPPPSPRTRRSTRPGRAPGRGRSVFALASATAPARSRPRTLNLMAIRRLPCSR